jgi:lactoylglutathione lyase
MIALAKPAIDLGLFTNRRDPMLAFWQQQAGLPFQELLPLGGGLQQHRHAIGDTVLKINHTRDPLPDAPLGGIRELAIARGDRTAATALSDPDGNRVMLVPPGHDGVTQIRVTLVVSDLQRHQAFYGGALGLPELDPRTFLCGVSQLRLEAGAAVLDPQQQAPGYRYLTIQVFDVRACHAEILRNGGREGRAPVRLGDVAHISFVRDPDGNWIEVSQRKSITGSLD